MSKDKKVIIMCAADYSERYLFYKKSFPVIRRQKVDKNNHKWRDMIDLESNKFAKGENEINVTNTYYMVMYQALKEKGYIRLETTLSEV